MTNKSSRFCPTSSQSQYQLSKAILNELNHIFFKLFDYPQNEDLKMKNEAYLFLAQLKEFFYFRDKWNEKQNKVFDILIGESFVTSMFTFSRNDCRDCVARSSL